ncbi:MAG: GH36-type glycosyl hydrolase domain-containing protein [Halanaerobiales bacterium]
MEQDKIHSFMNNDNSCLIENPRPPRHWYNYLWSEHGYCAQISQIGHGRSYYINEKADMCQINNSQARYVYIRDDDSNEYWNIGEGPGARSVDDYSCEHSIAYTKIKSRKAEIEASWRLFVPYDAYNEVWTIKLKNKSEKTRNISLFSVVSFELEGFDYPRYYEMYRSCDTQFDKELNGIYCNSDHPFAPHNRYNGYIASSEKVAAYDGDLAKFLGTTGTITKDDASIAGQYQCPDIVASGLDCTNSETALFMLGGVIQNKIDLKSGESKEIRIVFGVSKNLEEARTISERYSIAKNVKKALEDTEKHYYNKYNSLSIETPHNMLNSIMNNWLKKQVDFCIVGKKGVRDNLQIAVALLMYRQERARQEIIECLRHQFQDGHAVLTWYPYDDTRYSDQPFWIIWAVIELIKETGDYSILDLEVEYQDGGSGTVLEHLKAAVNRLIKDKGPNGLVRIYFADWNDALNITTDPEAESVMLSEQFCLALKEFKELAVRISENEYAEYLSSQYEELKEVINRVAWDGKWYVRAISKDKIIGSKDSEGSDIYTNAQTWAVLAEIVEEDRLSVVLESLDKVEHDFGFPINVPPNQKYYPHLGRMSGMLPGLFENGGVYCHATGFKIMMDCKVGRGDKAVDTLCRIMPDSTVNPSLNSGAEPYVFTNCYSIHPKYYGKSYQSWTTGTSAWAMMALYEGIMGIKRDYDGLRIDPCFPSDWERAEVTREFRGSRYRIVLEKSKEENISDQLQISVDGSKIEGNILPLFNDRKLHDVRVLI